MDGVEKVWSTFGSVSNKRPLYVDFEIFQIVL